MSGESEQAKTGGYQEHVKRPMNAFMVWAKTERRRLAMTLPGMPNSEVSKILGGLWKRLSDEEKSKYRSESESIRKQHRSEHPDYRYHPRRRAMKSAKQSTKAALANGRLAARKDQRARAAAQSVGGHSAQPATFYAQQQGVPVAQCMFRQAPEAYLSWHATPTAQLAQNNYGACAAAAPAGFYPTFVTGQSVPTTASRPATISFDGATRAEVTATVPSTAGDQCGWPLKVEESSCHRWSPAAGAAQTAGWASGTRTVVAQGDCTPDVGTPPALMHSSVGESPLSNASVSALCSPGSPLTRVTSPESIMSGPAHAPATVPTAEDDIVGYMQLYLGDSNKESPSLSKEAPATSQPLGYYEYEKRQRSASPPFSVPNATNDETRMYNYSPMTTSGTPAPFSASSTVPSSSPWSQRSVDSPLTSQAMATSQHGSFAYTHQLQQPAYVATPSHMQPLVAGWRAQ